jgi:hypothetical protein
MEPASMIVQSFSHRSNTAEIAGGMTRSDLDLTRRGIDIGDGRRVFADKVYAGERVANAKPLPWRLSARRPTRLAASCCVVG